MKNTVVFQIYEVFSFEKIFFMSITLGFTAISKHVQSAFKVNIP